MVLFGGFPGSGLFGWCSVGSWRRAHCKWSIDAPPQIWRHNPDFSWMASNHGLGCYCLIGIKQVFLYKVTIKINTNKVSVYSLKGLSRQNWPNERTSVFCCYLFTEESNLHVKQSASSRPYWKLPWNRLLSGWKGFLVLSSQFFLFFGRRGGSYNIQWYFSTTREYFFRVETFLPNHRKWVNDAQGRSWTEMTREPFFDKSERGTKLLELGFDQTKWAYCDNSNSFLFNPLSLGWYQAMKTEGVDCS